MLRVITYHRIGDPSDRPDLDPALLSASTEVFERQMEHLRRWYRPVSLRQIVEAFEKGRALPSRSVHVTFDDAYRDFRDKAWPVLKEMKIPVTVFVPTAYPDERERTFWWDRLHRARVDPRARADLRGILRMLPHDTTERFVDEACLGVEGVASGNGADAPAKKPPILGWDELRALKEEGVTFGAHTREHVALPFVDSDRIRREIRRSIEDLDRELGKEHRAIAYPYGLCTPGVAEIAREEGCVLGFTCEDGLNRPGETDRMRLRRSSITPRTSASVFVIRMLPWLANVDRWRHRNEQLAPAT